MMNSLLQANETAREQDFSWQIEEEIEVTDAPPEPVSRWKEEELTAGREDLAYQQMFRVMQDMRQALEERDEALAALRSAQHEILQRLAAVAEWKNPHSQRNNQRVGVLSALLAHYCGMSDEQCQLLEQAAPLRDLGLIGIPDTTLHKEGVLTADEQAIWQLHPAIGAQILQDSGVPELQLAAQIASEHHEHFDGTGYPQGLAGEDISLPARIVALIEFFDTQYSELRLSAAQDREQILRAEIAAHSSIQFDPVLSALLLVQLTRFITVRECLEARSSKESHTELSPQYWQQFI